MKRNKVEYWDDDVDEFKGKSEILPPAPKEEKTVNVNLGFGSTGFSPKEDRFWTRFLLILFIVIILFNFGVGIFYFVWSLLL